MSSSPHHYYDSFADEMVAKFRRVGHLIPNKAATGDYHEEILRSVLRNFLSKRFSVKTGFVYKSPQEVSNQIDIMIVDEYEVSAYIYQEGDFAIVRPHSVAAVLEVKTQLRSSDFDEALNNIASAKRLADNPDQICGMVFGYDGTIPSPSTLDNWFKREAATKLAEAPRLGPTLISFFQHGVLLPRLNFDKGVTIDDDTNYHPVQHTSRISNQNEPFSEGWQLRFILAMIYSVCIRREIQRTHTFQDNKEVNELLMLSGGVPSADHFEFGRGFVPRVLS
ncbi:MAG TPA: DUF6602 domain-containing protein [Ktedonobacterales bacterium]|nr:DUF6602 domain-containing protein [Ktedonobacterales bacterium]